MLVQKTQNVCMCVCVVEGGGRGGERVAGLLEVVT